VCIVENHKDLAVSLQFAEHLNQGYPDTQRLGISGSPGPKPGQPVRRPLTRLCNELVQHAVGKICLQLGTAYPQH
jgi:hypothetical protein